MEAAPGTLQEPAWTAQWIWVRGESWTVNFHAFARRAFRLTEPPRRALLRVAVCGDYALFHGCPVN